MNLKKNVVLRRFGFLVQYPQYQYQYKYKYIYQEAESREAARLIMKSREEAGEFKIIEDGDQHVK